jgi:hypothetical protein
MNKVDLKLQLVKEFGYDQNKEAIDFCREVYKFLTEDDEPQQPTTAADQSEATPETTPAAFVDGVYVVLKDGSSVKHEYGRQYADHIKGDCLGVGVKLGSKSVLIALHDEADGEEITLTKDSNKAVNHGHYCDNRLDAVADWDGAANTDRLKAEGLNDGISLMPGYYIPSLGELVFIWLHLKMVNDALNAVGAEPLQRDWYWSSTEYSSTLAWSLTLNDGGTRNGTKAANQFRVRAVSAFIS